MRSKVTTKSLRAEAVAHDMIAAVRRGEFPQVTKLAVARGYSKASAENGKVTRTKSYKRVMLPFLKKLEIERDRAIDKLKDRVEWASYRDLVDGIDKLTKNHRLLENKSTDNIAIAVKSMSDEELQKLTQSITSDDTTDSARS